MSTKTVSTPGRGGPPAADDVPDIRNHIGGAWVESRADTYVDVHNPGTGDVIARAPLSTGQDVDDAVAAATKALAGWRETPVVLRARAMFKYRELLDQHFEELAQLITHNQGKTLAEARGSMMRAIECVEVACAAA